MMYINQKYLNKTGQEYIMLEIKLPREIFKSPYATEVALASLLQSGGMSTWHARLFQGNLPIYSSLEIASIEGVVHFYIRVQGKFRSLVESNFYAQYPGIEIVEADDYTNLIRYHHLTKNVNCWGETYGLQKSWTPTNEEEGVGQGEPYKDKKGEEYKMKADFLPIKTYVDYGLDKDPKEEFKIDPITPLLEMMGSIGKGEYLWYQIILQDESVYDGKKMPKVYLNEVSHDHLSLKDMADKFKKQRKIGGWIKKGDKVYDDEGDVKQKQIGKDAEGKPMFGDAIHQKTKPLPKKEVDLSSEDKDLIEAVNKKLSKPLANVIIRMLYLANTDIGKFNTGNIQNILSVHKPFIGINSIGFKKTSDPYDFKWQNFRGRRTPWRTEEMFEAYVEREGFYPHIEERKSLDAWEDSFFWGYDMKTRKLWRMMYEGFFHPFSHPHPDEVFTLNLEELATLWHLPGAVATTPTLPRIDSAKGVAPVNLPQ